MKNYILLVIAICALLSCSKTASNPVKAQIIPIPDTQVLHEGSFVLSSKTGLEVDKNLSGVADYLKSYIQTNYSIELVAKGSKNISLRLNTNIQNDEAYELKVTSKEISIEAKTARGIFYGVQSLVQLFPVQSTAKEFPIQCLEIKDAPRFSYRGMHLDVGRHLFPVAFIKKYIDLLASLKFNTFHWHLTEDQGWRIEIKKFPKLQEIAAYRDETLKNHYNDQPHKFDGKKYGGYYTQEEIKEVVKYASERFVDIIPEIEMPGHSQAAIAAYPELGCTGDSVKVATKWGVFEEVYCPTETTFKFLEDVIDEVITLFPSKYIHIGGDEAPKARWKNSDFCQQLIKEKNLKDEHGLQSYFISRMEKYINSKGKQIIGWDEILEGGLAPNAAVMSWRGTKGAVEAAKQKHNVILTPTSHCYFDYYQSENENEPVAIGGFLPLEKAYQFNPIPKELTEEEHKYVLGAQGNVWTEYMKTPEKVEYMAFPRAIALAEVLWSTPSRKNFNEFKKRLLFFQKRLDVKKVNYANHLYELKGKLTSKNGELFYEFTPFDNASIFYTLNGKNPVFTVDKKYTVPFPIDSSTVIKAIVFDADGNQLSRDIFQQKINLHKAVGKKITLAPKPHRSYNAGGTQALINGVSGSNKRFGDKEWLGFAGDDILITLDLEQPTVINTIRTRFHNGNGQWIYAPKNIGVTFDNGEETLFKVENDSLLVNFNATFTNKNAQKIKIRIPNYGLIPEGRQGAGHKAWTFMDELIIE
ncbi:beta-N-acetylhexosaminidase [Tenacibaculum amylolyticum]|uniref:beta-N-acetylhexosaminidase n=1 Tax=Tenacibaculum amylolyticum TaxID=104269 RepID=UPI003895D798